MNLRLLITSDCNRSCEGCCNENYDLISLPKVKSFIGYDYISITGGEPMLYPNKVRDVIIRIREESPYSKIVMYTAKTKRQRTLIRMLMLLDGITVTLHEQYDVKPFIELHQELVNNAILDKSLRVNIVEGIKLPENINLDIWKVKYIVWQDDCPIPENEEFRRI